MRAWVLSLAAVAVGWGCQADPVPVMDQGEGGSGGDVAIDAMPGDMGQFDEGMGGSGGADPDAMVDLDVGPMVDVGVDAEVDAEVDAMVDMMEPDYSGPPVAPPDFEVVAVARRGQETIFVWVDEVGQLVQLLVDDAGRAEPLEIVETPLTRPTRVVAHVAAGFPWVAYGAPGEQITVYQPDLPGATKRVIEDLYGEPVLSPAREGVLVFGLDEAGAVAWRHVSNDLVMSPREGGLMDMPPPTAAGEVPLGVVLVLGDVEQCIEISAAGWLARSSFACAGDRVQIVSDGQQPLSTMLYQFGNAQRIGLRRLYGKRSPERVLVLEFLDGLSFALDGQRRPVVGSGTQGQTVAAMIGPYDTWETAESWADFNSSPFGRVRAMAQRALPGRADRALPGAEEGEEAEQFAVALDFRASGSPRVRVLPLRRRGTHSLGNEANCVPRAETCDGADEDCDSVVNNGLCCEGPRDQAAYRWTLAGNRRVARVATPDGGERFELLMADVEFGDAYRLLYRLENTYTWEGKTFHLRPGIEMAPLDLRVTFEGAVDGQMLLGAGGTSVLIARRAPAEPGGEPGGLAVFFNNASEAENPRLKDSVDIDCPEILAADVLDHSVPVEGAGGEQVVVVCPDKIMRIHANEGILDLSQPVATLGVPRLGWATMLRESEDQLAILVGYEFGNGEGWNAARFVIQSANRPVLQAQPGGALNYAQGSSLRYPTYLQPPVFYLADDHPPVQIIDGREARVPVPVTVDDRDVLDWKEMRLAPMPDRTVPGRTSSGILVYSAMTYSWFDDEGEEQSETGWWVAEVEDVDEPFNFWSNEPAFTIDGGVEYWRVTRGPYDARSNAVVFNYPLALITSTDNGAGGSWMMRTRQAQCSSP